MDDGRGVQVIANPISGRAGSRSLVAELCRKLGRLGWPVQVDFTCGPGDAPRLAARCRPDELRAVIVVGGDGTVREAATSTDVPVAILPTGTENLLARYFGMRRSVDSLCRLLQNGRPTAIDVAAMSRGDADRRDVRRFLLMSGMGFDAEVVRRLTARRKGHITHGDYFWPIWRTLGSYQHPRMVVETESGTLFKGRGLVFVGNIPRYAAGLRICLQASPRDEKLDVCIFECHGQIALLWHAFKTLLRRHVGSSHVLYDRASRVRVTADRHVAVQLDGDLAGALPAEFEIIGQKAIFLAPAEWQA